MANHKSTLKRIKQNEKRHQINRVKVVRLRTEMKKFFAYVEAKDENMEAQFRLVTKLLDKAQAFGLLHRNNVARKKSRMARYLKEAQTA